MHNRLLASLPPLERDTLSAHLEQITLRPGEHLMQAGDPAAFVYFLDDAIATLSVGSGHVDPASEITTIGFEGVLGVPHVFVDAPAGMDATVRIGGAARRIPTAQFRHALTSLPALRATVDRYAHILVLQLARAALCERRHSIEQRLSTLILLTHDRTGGGNVSLTHEQLGDMLGVRRAGVTEVATKLRSQSAIQYRRGRVSVTDRQHLLGAACGCYESYRDEFQSVTGESWAVPSSAIKS
jgi:CRP-like cAMP-binding protein